MRNIQPEKKYLQISIYTFCTVAALILFFLVLNNINVIVDNIGLFYDKTLGIIKPIIMGLVIGYLLNRPTNFVQHYASKIGNTIAGKLKRDNQRYNDKSFRVTSILIIYSVIIASIYFLAIYLLPQLISNVNSLLSEIPGYANQIQKYLQTVQNEMQSNMQNVPINITDHIQTIALQLQKVMSVSINYLIAAIGGFTVTILNFVLALIIAFYVLKDKDRICRYTRKSLYLFKERTADRILRITEDVDRVFGQYMVGTVLDSIFVATVTFLLMFSIHHPFALLTGIIAGISNVIPYFGPLIGAAVAAILGLFASPTIAFWAVVLILILQQIEGNFIQPKIVGDKVGLNPFIVLIAVLIGGGFFGALGMILSVPVAALLKLYFDRYIVEKRRNQQS